MPMYYGINPKGNSKTGPIMVTSSPSTSCPAACPLRDGGCYGKHHFSALRWAELDNGSRGERFEDMCKAIAGLPEGSMWRHNQVGDLPGRSDEIDGPAMFDLIRANLGRKGFTFTHKPVLMEDFKQQRFTSGRDADGSAPRRIVEDNRLFIWAANTHGFAVNLSANSLEHADQLADLDLGPVATLLPADAGATTRTPKGRRVVTCPAATGKSTGCSSCGLCAEIDRDYVIGFPVHGSGAHKAAEAIVNFSE